MQATRTRVAVLGRCRRGGKDRVGGVRRRRDWGARLSGAGRERVGGCRATGGSRAITSAAGERGGEHTSKTRTAVGGGRAELRPRDHHTSTSSKAGRASVRRRGLREGVEVVWVEPWRRGQISGRSPFPFEGGVIANRAKRIVRRNHCSIHGGQRRKSQIGYPSKASDVPT